jgi:hypothetical protein
MIESVVWRRLTIAVKISIIAITQNWFIRYSPALVTGIVATSFAALHIEAATLRASKDSSVVSSAFSNVIL